MILGIGTDIVEVSRIRTVLQRHPVRFLNKIFTAQEQAYCLKHKDPALHLAGRFAAKEAIVKALGTGFRQGLNWLDIEIQPNLKGKPMVLLSSFANQLFQSPHLHLSISHCHEYATAFAIWTAKEVSSKDSKD